MEMFNQQLHPLAACPVWMRGGGFTCAATRQLVERNMIGWRRKVMIRVPGQREIVEAHYELSHPYLSFRLDDNETGRANDTGQADVNFGERDNPFMLNFNGGYAVVSSDSVAVRNRDQWNKCCILARSLDYICLPTGNQLN
jgi:hypothetical protein